MDYLRACTRPDDRVLVLADASEVLAFAGRLFAGGHPTFRAGFYTLPADQALTIARLSRQSVPVVLTRDWLDYNEHIESGFQGRRGLGGRAIQSGGHIEALTGGLVGVLVRRELAESRTVRPLRFFRVSLLTPQRIQTLHVSS